jgi:hypothetical protein
MNEELLAANVLFVQSGTFLVLMVLSTFLKLSSVKPTQVCSAPAVRKAISTTLAAPQREL